MTKYEMRLNDHNEKWEIYRVYQIDQVKYRHHYGYFKTYDEAKEKINQLNAIHEGLKQEQQQQSKYSNLAEQLGHKILVDIRRHGLTIRQISQKYNISYATARKIRKKVIEDAN